VAVLFSDLPEPEKVAVIRTSLETWGPLAPLAYTALVVVEVVIAPLPGTLLYAPGGALFGGLTGGIASLAGNVIGAGVAFGISRLFGADALHRTGSPRLEGTLKKLESHGVWVVFLLRVNPLTSSDLVSYAAGLTRIPLWQLLLGTFLGMAPLCFAQAYLAERLLTAFPVLLGPLLLMGIAYAVAAIYLLRR
jgi:uncharacterized membrane protein YdjX (TVP38/TMEM64 family)